MEMKLKNFNAQDLRKIADTSNKEEGKKFVLDIIPKIEKTLASIALMGKYAFEIRDSNVLNTQNNFWLEKPHLYNAVIKNLEEKGFTVYHSNEVRDGTYLVIKW